MDEEACKIIVGGEVRTIIDPDDKKTIKSIFDKRRSDGFTIKTVGEIASSGMAFFIPAYQRGYRWGEDEVCALFDDIDEFLKKDEDGFYCLQPLIVRKRDSFEARKSLESIVSGGEGETQSGETPEFVYELIDGQQRLTTIWLLLFALAGGKPPYRIYYEIPRNVDEDFILSAKGLLERKCATLAEGARLDLRKEIEWKAVFLLYEVVEKGEESSEKVFRQINKGKIELTNAELFKALLLDDELDKTEQERREQEIIAFEWDKIEQSLRNDSFWFFISNDKSDERTRIDYILDIYADALNDDKKLDPEKDRYSFLAVQAHLKSKGDYSFTAIRTPPYTTSLVFWWPSVANPAGRPRKWCFTFTQSAGIKGKRIRRSSSKARSPIYSKTAKPTGFLALVTSITGTTRFSNSFFSAISTHI